MSEFEPKPHVTIKEAVAEDVREARAMQARSWLATYPNEENGVSEEWVRARTEHWLAPEVLDKSVERLDAILHDPTQFYRLAMQYDTVVGFVHLTTKEDGSKYLEAIYTEPSTFGSGVGDTLMKTADTWIGASPVTLEVVRYNARAITFYQKHGFEMVPDSEHLYADTMPVVYMKRGAHE